MAPRLPQFLCLALLLLVLFVAVGADDISRDEDDDAPKTPGCDNKFQLVKIKNWVNGVESPSVVGLSARFGTSLPTHASEALKTPTVLANPFNCCTDSSIEGDMSGTSIISLGKEFETDAEAYNFYNSYARNMSFRVKKKE